MSILITGVAGFIGCNLARVMLGHGKTVIGFDNLCRGSMKNLEPIIQHSCFKFLNVDLTDIDSYRIALQAAHQRSPVTEIWHLAANSDIPAGVMDSGVDLRDTFMTTHNTLALMKELSIRTMSFSSSSAVYGDLGSKELVEDAGPLFPISYYGAMKLASEAAISAAVESHLDHAYIFRFPNVIGIPATHGVILDFIRKLKDTPNNLQVLGNGTQQKSYLHADELIEAMFFIRSHAKDRLNYHNIGAADEGVTVKFIAETVLAQASPGARITFGEGNKGWVGDVPRFSYSIEKLTKLGWHPKLSSAQAISKAVGQIVAQESGK